MMQNSAMDVVITSIAFTSGRPSGEEITKNRYALPTCGSWLFWLLVATYFKNEWDSLAASQNSHVDWFHLAIAFELRAMELLRSFEKRPPIWGGPNTD